MGTAHAIVVVGQTPPPWGGQAVMIRQLLDHPPAGVTLTPVRMAFSEDMDVVGKFRWRKLVHLGQVVARVLWARLRSGGATLYYPPAGPQRVPFYRDVVILGLTRWCFRATVFHFHASGLSSLYPRLNAFERWCFRRVYRRPDVAIHISDSNPPDGVFLEARHAVTVPYGLPDVWARFQEDARAARAVPRAPRVLFVGALYESKGLRVLIEAAALLKARQRAFTVECVGRFESADLERAVRAEVQASGLSAHVTFPGVLAGDDKWRAYARADVFCFPSFFESESFGLVNLEAMMFALPVVSTRWRGIPTVVRDGESGVLVAVRDAVAVADALDGLLGDAARRQRMGEAGRRLYVERFSLEAWRTAMGRALALASPSERMQS